MNDPEEIEEENWLADERRKVLEYLEVQGCDHGGVAEWPVIHIYQDFALWEVQSSRHWLLKYRRASRGCSPSSLLM